MHRLKENLKILELEGIPDLDTLQRHFKRLIKQVHPDLNMHRGDWAHDRSRRLIHAFQSIRDAILAGELTPAAHHAKKEEGVSEQQRAPQASRFRTGGAAEGGGGQSGRTEGKDLQRSLHFQLIRMMDKGYALPVDNIVRVISYADPSIKKGAFGPYCNHESCGYPIVSLDSRRVPNSALGFVVLFRIDAAGLGLYIHDDMKFIEVKAFRENEVVIQKEGSARNGWVLHDNVPYLYPESQIRSMVESFAPGRATATKSG